MKYKQPGKMYADDCYFSLYTRAPALVMREDTGQVAYDDVLHTGVVTECVENSYEVVQAGPVVWVTVQSLLKGMSSQRNAHQSHSHLTNFVPHVHISGIQNNCLRKEQSRKYGMNTHHSVIHVHEKDIYLYKAVQCQD